MSWQAPYEAIPIAEVWKRCLRCGVVVGCEADRCSFASCCGAVRALTPAEVAAAAFGFWQAVEAMPLVDP